MKLDELVLERYGRFQDFRLTLNPDGRDDGVCLHVIYGPNEAGKSTALQSISDLLFGIDERTSYGFAHGYDNLLIGATLSNRAGQTLTVRRRKGRKNTLLDAQGLALPETALAPFLGGLSPEAFKREFGLDYHRLRNGGDLMLEAGGDLAHSLFQASGLPGIVEVQNRLKADADSLWSPQRKAAGKLLWRTLDEYREARQRMNRDWLRPEDWSRAVAAALEAGAALDARKAELEDLRRERNRLQRLRGALPVLVRLDDLTEQWAALADAPDLPADFAEGWRQAVARELRARAEVERLTDELTRQRAVLDQLAPSGPLPAHAARIERLFHKSGDLAAKRDDRPKLQRELEHSDARLGQFIVQLGGGFTLADLDRHRPSKPVAARVRDLIAGAKALEADAAARAGQAEEARERLRDVEQALAALGQPVDAAEARAALDQALKVGEDIETRLAAAERAGAQAEATATAALARLGRWTGSLSALAATPFPDPATVQEALTAGQTLEADRRRDLEARDQALEEVRRVEGELRDLESGAEIPTPEALAQARRHRDQGWRLIRGGYIDRTLDPARAAAGYAPETGDLATAYEEAVHRADDLVDRRERDAQRVQRYLTLQRQAEKARDVAARRQAGLAELDGRMAAHHGRWLALWQASGLARADLESAGPTAMLAWLGRKDEAVRAADARSQAEGEAERLRRQLEVLRQNLLRAGALLGLAGLGGQPTPALRDRVRTAVDRAAAAWTEAGRLGRERLRLGRAVEKAEAALAAAGEARRDWQAGWVQDLRGLGLAETAGIAEATAALGIWEAIETELVRRRENQRRLDGIEADLAAGRLEVTRFLAQLGEAAAGPADSDPLDLPQTLHQRLKEAQKLADQRQALGDRITGHEAELAAARQEWEAAGQGLSVLRASHGLEAAAEPLVEAERAGQRRTLAGRLAEARRELADQAAGHTEEALRAEARDADPDALGARVQAIEEEERRLQQALEDAKEAALIARQQVDALNRRAGIQEAAQQANDAEQRAGAYANRWVRLWAAQTILDKAIEGYRTANEHPLVRRASEVFALVAGTGANPIERLIVAYGKKDQPVLKGVRRDRSECPVEGMSDGTRDQLYLALRIAAVEAAATAGEPMPFIADDLFITSDDQRTAPGLKALAGLGRVTQVLLFTHHRSVVEIARAVVEARALRVHELGGRDGG
jgi:uncharacterized protein YhaN